MAITIQSESYGPRKPFVICTAESTEELAEYAGAWAEGSEATIDTKKYVLDRTKGWTEEGSGGSGLPDVTSADYGKVLRANSDGWGKGQYIDAVYEDGYVLTSYTESSGVQKDGWYAAFPRYPAIFEMEQDGGQLKTTATLGQIEAAFVGTSALAGRNVILRYVPEDGTELVLSVLTVFCDLEHGLPSIVYASTEGTLEVVTGSPTSVFSIAYPFE